MFLFVCFLLSFVVLLRYQTFVFAESFMMDAQPSTSSRRRNEETLSPRKKRKLKSFSQTEKEMIMNAYKYVSIFWKENRISNQDAEKKTNVF